MDKPKKYYEYYYTWSMAEARRKVHDSNGRDVCGKPQLNSDRASPKQWVIWYNRITDTKREGTVNARYYDK